MYSPPEMQAWVDRARDVRIEDEAARRNLPLKRKTLVELHGPCPRCGGDDRFFINIRKQMFHCRRCTAGGDVIDMVQFLDGCSFQEACQLLNAAPPPASDWVLDRVDRKRRGAEYVEQMVTIAKRVWRESTALPGSMGEFYLRHVRCIALETWPPTVRFHPHLAHGPLSEGRSFPGIVCPVQNQAGEFRGIWRIFLDPTTGNKAQVEEPRLGLGDIAGGGVRLTPVGHEVVLGEGIETMLAVLSSGPGRSYLAGLSTSIMRRIELPAQVQSVILLEENDLPDKNGRRASSDTVQALSARLVSEGRQVRIARPPEGFKDFNDILMGELPVQVSDTPESTIADIINGAEDVGDDTAKNANGAGAYTDRHDKPKAPPLQPDDLPGEEEEENASEPKTLDVVEVKKRPGFLVFDQWVIVGSEKFRPGVWYFGIKPATGNAPEQLINQWITTPIHIEAITHDNEDNNFGRCLRFRNTNKRWRAWAMPMELLAGDGTELRAELLAMGVEIDPHSKHLLAQYLLSHHPERKMLCALQVGWCGNSFVLPDVVIGPGAANVIFQSGERGHEEYTKGGTFAGWQSEIAAMAVGNPMLGLAISASFAGSLLYPCNAESGGLHLFGDSSIGKTTELEGSCATWGGPNFKRSWRATANGMEGAAALYNDNFMPLDEISECPPKEINAIVYMLANGRGKQRASRTGNARSVLRWRCFIVSTGERTIATAMLEGGIRAKAGQSIRILDVPCQRKFGIFDELRGFANGPAFSDALRRSATKHYGHAGRAFLEKLTRDQRNMGDLLEKMKQVPAFNATGAEGQDKRAAARFALVALAGELAIEYGILPWKQGDAVKAAKVGYDAWQSQRTRGNDEPRQILDRVNAFIERHGDARFSDKDAPREDKYGNSTPGIRDRTGWWTDDATHGRVYLFTSDGLREALTGFDFSRALNVLEAAGALVLPNEKSEHRKAYKIGGRKVSLYAIVSEKLGASDGT
jgi:putative DNA primase/helicase